MIVLQTPKGWTGPKSVGREARRGDLPRAPGASVRSARESGAPAAAGGVAAQLPARRALRRRRTLRPGSPGARSGRRAPHGREPERQRRPAAARAAAARTSGATRSRCRRPGKEDAEDTRVLGTFLRDVMKLNDAERNFRLFGPDETLSNRLNAVFETTNRQWEAETQPHDEFLAREGRVIEVLSEHQCQGFLEGYLLTGRHGLFNSYEAFIHIVDSMFNQHAKWLKVTRELPWRAPIASLNYLLSSHVWQQDHNGFTHQDPGFIDVACNKKAEVVRVYLPPDANSLLFRNGPLPPQPPLREHRRRRQGAVSPVAHDGRRGPALHRGNRGLGLGQQRRRRRARPRDGGRRRRAHPRDARGRDDPAAPAAEAQDPHRQRRRPHEAPARRASIRTACPTTSSTRSSRRTSRSSSRTTAIPG